MPAENKNTLRKIFFTGLLVLLPIATTVLILVFLFNLLDGWLAPVGGEILRALGVRLPGEMKHVPGFGILATLLLIFLTGVFASNYLGRQILRFGDRLIRSIPVVNSIYSAMRQVVNSFSATGASAFKKVAIFEYPRRGLWALGFITTPSITAARQATGEELVNVFLPTTPNPTSGFLLMVPFKDLHVLPTTPEEALKIIATVGLIQKEISLPEAADRVARAAGRRLPRSSRSPARLRRPGGKASGPQGGQARARG